MKLKKPSFSSYFGIWMLFGLAPIPSIAGDCPMIHLNLDLNGTVIWDDPAGQKDVKEGVEAAFAKSKRHAQQWEPGGAIIPLNDHLKDMKKAEKKESISKWLDQAGHRPSVDAILNQLSSSLDGASEKTTAVIFPSLLGLFEFLKSESIEFRVTLRTFGTDGPRVSAALSKALSSPESSVQFRSATFIGEERLRVVYEDPYSETGQLIRMVQGHNPIARFIQNERYLTIQDDYSPWGRPASGPREHWSNGKKFYFESDPKVLALFFDDNANFHDNPHGEDIVCPIDRSGEKVSPASLYGRQVFQVSTLEAGTDRNYFIDLVLPVLRSFPGCLSEDL